MRCATECYDLQIGCLTDVLRWVPEIGVTVDSFMDARGTPFGWPSAKLVRMWSANCRRPASDFERNHRGRRGVE